MFSLINNIKISLDKNKKCIAIFLYLTKAFDTVLREKLTDVLERYGVRGMVMNVLKATL